MALLGRRGMRRTSMLLLLLLLLLLLVMRRWRLMLMLVLMRMVVVRRLLVVPRVRRLRDRRWTPLRLAIWRVHVSRRGRGRRMPVARVLHDMRGRRVVVLRMSRRRRRR